MKWESHGYVGVVGKWFNIGDEGFGCTIMIKRKLAAWAIGFEFVKRGFIVYIGPFLFGLGMINREDRS
ncbi:hypothetical protein MXMO3_01690 [Maritalea myrionectae]|uniref:Uncharacterized protein n=1 Tax=Maritalea myrionectae TaxID=454601 RepID=A0A2R4ME96_9HYPH|nr:hypothetical protein MXMO3_01690 [Maritalea myrionectae]